MQKIHDIEVKAENHFVEESVKFLYQASLVYEELNSILPAGQFKDDILSFAAKKREEYIQGITSNAQV